MLNRQRCLVSGQLDNRLSAGNDPRGRCRLRPPAGGQVLGITPPPARNADFGGAFDNRQLLFRLFDYGGWRREVFDPTSTTFEFITDQTEMITTGQPTAIW